MNRRGFTLMELMVATAIVSALLLAMVSAVPFIKGRVRDSRRQEELVDLQRAIEIYHADKGVYPTTLPNGSEIALATESDAYTSTLPSAQFGPVFIPNFTGYYPTLPIDPYPGPSTVPGCQALGYNRTYIYLSNGDHYKLISHCASETGDYSPDYRFYDPARPDWAWALSDDINYTSFTLGW